MHSIQLQNGNIFHFNLQQLNSLAIPPPLLTQPMIYDFNSPAWILFFIEVSYNKDIGWHK